LKGEAGIAFKVMRKYTTILLDLEIFLSSMKLKFWQDV
jgi:hypothetical protein